MRLNHALTLIQQRTKPALHHVFTDWPFVPTGENFLVKAFLEGYLQNINGRNFADMIASPMFPHMKSFGVQTSLPLVYLNANSYWQTAVFPPRARAAGVLEVGKW